MDKVHLPLPLWGQRTLWMKGNIMPTHPDHTDIADRVWDEVFHHGNFAVIDEAFDSEFVCEAPRRPKGIQGPDEFKAFVNRWRDGLPIHHSPSRIE